MLAAIMSSIPVWIVVILVICMVAEPDALPVTKPGSAAAGPGTPGAAGAGTPAAGATTKPPTGTTTRTPRPKSAVTTTPVSAPTTGGAASTTVGIEMSADPSANQHMTCRRSYWIILGQQKAPPSVSVETRRGPARGHFPCLSSETCYSVPKGELWRVYVLRNDKYPEIFGNPLQLSGVYKISTNGTEVIPEFSDMGFQIFEVNLITAKYPRTHYHVIYEYQKVGGEGGDKGDEAKPVVGKLYMHFRKLQPVASVYTAYPAIPNGAQLTALKIIDIDTQTFGKNVTDTGNFYRINIYSEEKKIRYFTKADASMDYSIILMEKHLGAVAAVTEQYARRLVPPAVTCVDSHPCYSLSHGGNWHAYILRYTDKFPEVLGLPLTVPPGVYTTENGTISAVETFLPRDGKDGKEKTHLFEAQVVHLGIPKEQLQLIYEYETVDEKGETKSESARLGLTFYQLYGRECHLMCHPALPPGSKLVYLAVSDGTMTLMDVIVEKEVLSFPKDGKFYHVKVDLIEGLVNYSK